MPRRRLHEREGIISLLEVFCVSLLLPLVAFIVLELSMALYMWIAHVAKGTLFGMELDERQQGELTL